MYDKTSSPKLYNNIITYGYVSYAMDSQLFIDLLPCFFNFEPFPALIHTDCVSCKVVRQNQSI